MWFKRATAENVSSVLRRLADLLETDLSGERSVWAVDLNIFLDDLANEDAFGTEGQLDPRGDQRD